MKIVRMNLAATVIKDWHTCDMDVTNAFVHGHLDEEAYIMLPKGYRGKGEHI